MLQTAGLTLMEDLGVGTNRRRQQQRHSTLQMVRGPCDCVADVPRLLIAVGGRKGRVLLM
jgi:hypothetical protein